MVDHVAGVLPPTHHPCPCCSDKISLKFYTDPDFFFRKWVTEQQEMLKAAKAEKKEKRCVFSVPFVCVPVYLIPLVF